MWVKEAEIGETWCMLGDIRVVVMIILKWNWDQIDYVEVSQIDLAHMECDDETYGDLDEDVP